MYGKLLLLAVLVLLGAPARAAPNITVDGVQMPAWVERQALRIPLGLDTPLESRDRIITGAGARVLLRLADGSLIKLGENAVLSLEDVARKTIDLNEIVTAAIRVLAGAFRFTAHHLARERVRRDVRIQISAITVGIRGTDVWGKSAGDRDIVCLIEGSIGVEHQGRAFSMVEPLSFFVAPREGKALPVAPVSAKQLEEWAAETEMQAGAGVARAGGRHRARAAVADSQRDALAAYDALRAAGYAAEILPVKQDGAVRYHVGVGSLASDRDARSLAERFKVLGFAQAAATR